MSITVGELRAVLKGAPDETKIYIESFKYKALLTK